MMSLMESELWWLLPLSGLSFLLNSVVLILAVCHQRKRGDRLLEKARKEVNQHIRLLEEELEDCRREQGECWAEVRKTIARLEFRGGGATERFQRSSMVGLDKKHQICSLARQGLTTEEITRKLNLYRGETELVLGLRKYGARTEINDARTTLQ